MRGKPAQTIDETTQPSIPSILWIIRWPGLEHLVWVESDETKMETLGTLRRWWALNEDGFVEQACAEGVLDYSPKMLPIQL